MPLTDQELYEGFSQATIDSMKAEVHEKYDPALVAESDRRIAKMSKERWRMIQHEGDDITQAIADMADQLPDDAQVQSLIRKHHGWIENFYPVNRATYEGLGQMYTDDDRFRAYYDKFRPGLADFLRRAMETFSRDSLAG